MMKMYDCPKFESCSAPACPLWKPVHKQIHLNGERTCYYLIQAQKEGSKAIFEQSGLSELHEVMVQATSDAFSNPDTSIYLEKSLRKAATTSSSMSRGQNLIKRYKNGEFAKHENQNAKV